MVERITQITITGDTSKYERSMRNAQLTHEKTIGQIKAGWLQITAAMYATAKAYDALKLGARATQEAQAFANMAASHGANADKIIADLKRASVGTVDTMTMIQKAGTAMMMGIDPEKISGLMAIARATSKLTGQTVVEAFSDMTLATARQSKMILDNLGILVSVAKANEEYAKKLKITGRELTDTEKKAAFLNAAIETGGDLMKRLGGETKSTAEMFQSLEAFAKNVWVAISQGALWVIKNITIAYTLAGKTINLVLQRTAEAILWFVEMWNKFPLAAFQIPIEPLQAVVDQLRMAVEESNKFAAVLIDLDKAGITVKLPGTAPPSGAPGGDTTKADKARQKAMEWELEQENIMYQAIFDTTVDWDEKLIEQKTARLEHEQEMIATAMQWEIEQENAMHEALFGSSAEYAQKQIDLAQQTEDQIKSIKAQSRQYQWSIAEGLATGMAAIAGASAKEIFLITKAFEIAQAIAATHAAYTLALAQPPGPPKTIPLAQAVFAMGMLHVAAIAATTFSQMSQSSTGGGTVGAGTYTSPVITAPAAESKPSLTIIIEGDFIGDESYIDNLVERINEAEDRDVYIRRTLYAREVE